MNPRLFTRPLRNPNHTQTLYALVVDDNLGNRLIATRYLQNIFGKENINIEYAEDGKVAVGKVKQKIENDNEDFDIIIMDNDMPNMNGEEATQLIKALEITNNLEDDLRSVVAAWTASGKTYGDVYFEKGTNCGQIAEVLGRALLPSAPCLRA